MSDDINVERGVVFGQGGGRALRCDVYSPPDGAANRVGVLMLHGGGWRRGEPAMMEGYALELAQRGFVCVASEYRLTPEAPWPAQIHDAKTAVRWIRTNATRLGIDPAKICVQGSSAGAHLALMLGGTPGHPEFDGDGDGTSTEVAAIVAVFPPVVFHLDERISGSVPARALLGDDPAAEVAHAAGPINHVSPDFPPTCLLHGTDDRTVPVSASFRMYEALTAQGVPAELHIFPGEPHGFTRQPDVRASTAHNIAHFLDRYVVDPERHAKAREEVLSAMAGATAEPVSS